MKALLVCWLAWELLKPKAKTPRGNVEIGEPTIGSSPDEWANPFPVAPGDYVPGDTFA